MSGTTTTPAWSYNQQHTCANTAGHLYHSTQQFPCYAEGHSNTAKGVPAPGVEQYVSGNMMYNAGITQETATPISSNASPDAGGSWQAPALSQLIVVKNVPRRQISESFLYDLVQEHVSADVAAGIETMEIARHRVTGAAKGHALVKLGTSAAAEQTAGALDGVVAGGRTLTARISYQGRAGGDGTASRALMGLNNGDHADQKEGASPEPVYIGQQDEDWFPTTADEENNTDEGKGKGKERERETVPPVVADGSTGRSKKTSHKKRHS